MPTGGSAVEVLRGFPVLEVRMVSSDDEGYFSPTQIWPPVSEGLHYSQKFLFIDVVVSFSGCKGYQVIG